MSESDHEFPDEPDRSQDDDGIVEQVKDLIGLE